MIAASDRLVMASVAGWSGMPQVLLDVVAVYRFCSIGDSAQGGDAQGPPREQVRPVLVAAAQVADVLRELRADVLPHRGPVAPAIGYPQAAADTPAQRCRWAAVHVD